MAEKHPDELELLSFVEEELDGAARREVAEHLVACRTCADQVRRLETARDALRSAQLLELPEERRAEMIEALPERRDPWRLFRPAKRVLVVAAPVAAAAALVGVLVLGGTQLRSGGDDEEAGGGDAAADATMLEGATDRADEEAAPGVPLQGATFVRNVRGPATEIVRLLESEGITAGVDPSGAVVADALAADVRAALEARPAGEVPVYVR